MADIVMKMSSGTEVTISFANGDTVVKTLSTELAQSYEAAVEEFFQEISPSDGDPNYALSRMLAERFDASVVHVTPAAASSLADGQEVVY
jgi:hypothetical protein